MRRKIEVKSAPRWDFCGILFGKCAEKVGMKVRATSDTIFASDAKGKPNTKGGDGTTATEEKNKASAEGTKRKARGTKRCKGFTSVKQLDNMIDDYFDRHLAESGEVADIESLADFLCMTRDELIRLTNDEKYGRSVRFARNRIAKIKKQLAFCGKIPAAVLSFDLKNNHGYLDKPEAAEGGEPIVFSGKAADWAK